MLDSLSQDLVLHILDSRDDDDPGGYSMLQLQEVARLGACSRALRSVVGVWATTPSAYGGAFRRWVEEEATLYPHYRAQVLYPWTQLRIKAEAEAAEAKRAAAKRAAAERRDAEGERTGERPRKRSRLPISPVRGG